MDNKRELFNRFGNHPVPGTPKLDPFLNARGKPLDAVVPATPDIVERIKNTYNDPVPIIMPRTTSAPEGARTMFLKRWLSIPANDTVVVFEYTSKAGATTVFNKYALGTIDGIQFGDLIWRPYVDDKRVLQFHGQPNAQGSFDLLLPQNIALLGYNEGDVECQILLEPGQKLRWEIENTTASPILAGLHMKGYLDMSQRLTSTKFGD